MPEGASGQTDTSAGLDNSSAALRYCLELRGTFRLLAPEGSDISNRLGKKGRALVAVLAAARGRPTDRNQLRRLLWSRVPETHSRNSLSKALTALRRALDDPGGTLLQEAADRVVFDPMRICVDLFEPEAFAAAATADAEVLADFEIKEPGFERWLAKLRDAHPPRPYKPFGIASGVEGYAPLSRLSIAILPVAALGDDGAGHMVGDMILSRMALALRQLGVFHLQDARSDKLQVSRAADVELCLKAFTMDNAIRFYVRASDQSDGSILWDAQQTLPVSEITERQVAPIVTGFVDQIADALYRSSMAARSVDRSAGKNAMRAIDHMFRLSDQDLDMAAAALESAVATDPRGIYYAWSAFLATYRLEQAKGHLQQSIREEAIDLARIAMELEPHNPLALSLITHVYGFMHRDFERAFEIVGPVRELEADNPLFFDNIAMLHFYTGGLEEARRYASKAVDMGRFSRFRYSLETSLCMIEAVSGNFDAAIRHGERAMAAQHMQAEKYEPTMRYLGAAYAMRGDLDRAGNMLACIRRQSPSFSAKTLDDPSFPAPGDTARQMLRTGLNRIPAFREVDRE
ncbi:MAG: tetratricopeptide repeat protein [Pseudomonadota bacterium]